MQPDVLIPLPRYGFDPTEVAVPWQELTRAGFTCRFATPEGRPAAADAIMLNGKGLSVWKRILMAREDAVSAYESMLKAAEFQSPSTWSQAASLQASGLLLPGGHDPGVREYLESAVLQQLSANYFRDQLPVAAICHGVIVLARARSSHNSGVSVLHGYKTTALLRSQEMAAWQMTRLWLNNYYRTYPDTTVQEEVTGALASKDDFVTGPTPLWRDSPTALQHGFVCQDRHYLSARWPGDAYAFSNALIRLLGGTKC